MGVGIVGIVGIVGVGIVGIVGVGVGLRWSSFMMIMLMFLINTVTCTWTLSAPWLARSSSGTLPA